MSAPETETIRVLVNGEPRVVPAQTSIQELLELIGLDPSRVAVEYNRRIVKKPEWAETLLESGAQLEIVQFVGGG